MLLLRQRVLEAFQNEVVQAEPEDEQMVLSLPQAEAEDNVQQNHETNDENMPQAEEEDSRDQDSFQQNQETENMPQAEENSLRWPRRIFCCKSIPKRSMPSELLATEKNQRRGDPYMEDE